LRIVEKHYLLQMIFSSKYSKGEWSLSENGKQILVNGHPIEKENLADYEVELANIKMMSAAKDLFLALIECRRVIAIPQIATKEELNAVIMAEQALRKATERNIQ
jgi:restriction endonuclease Mrr